MSDQREGTDQHAMVARPLTDWADLRRERDEALSKLAEMTDKLAEAVEAARALAEAAEDGAASLDASENLETPRYVAEDLRRAVGDFRAAVAVLYP